MAKIVFLQWILIPFVLISCSNKSSKPNPIIDETYKDDDMKFPEGKPLFVFLIKLNEPALLNSLVQNKSGHYVVDEQKKAKVLREQEKFLGKLKAISDEIKILYRYKMVLNGFAVEAPQEFADEISRLKAGLIESNELFTNGSSIEDLQWSNGNYLQSSLTPSNPLSVMDVDKVHKYFKAKDQNGNSISLKGRGIKVGIIDSGIDYTHKMFGGPGDPSVFKSVDPTKNTAFFPTSRVVGGKDFVGDSFSVESKLYKDQVPAPDNNPIDLSGHGTHVAGILGGYLEEGGNVEYKGVAPEAELYALKVFSAKNKGGTSTMVIIAALEYSVNPNNDFSVDDRLDVVNLSIQYPLGNTKSLMIEAVNNLTKAGVVVVAAGGNAGNRPNVVAEPGVAESAISVASSSNSVSDLNNYNSYLQIDLPNREKLLFEFKEGADTTPVSQAFNRKGKLVFINYARSLTEKQKEDLKGQIALVDRGYNSFSEKVAKAYEAGAIGVVVVNDRHGNVEGLISLDQTIPIPVIFISLETGQIIKEALEQETEVNLDFGSLEFFGKPFVKDQIAIFSSRGPRVFDSLIKPEICAPGVDIFSAKFGSGHEGEKQPGTSVSSPYVAGVASLLLQYRKDLSLSPNQVKSLIVNTGSLIKEDDDEFYPISRQGAGRMNAYRALKMDIVSSRPTLSLGHHSVSNEQNLTESFELQNIADRQVTYNLDPINSDFMKISLSTNQVTLAPGQKTEVEASIQLKPNRQNREVTEANGFISLSKEGKNMGFIPVLAMVKARSDIKVDQFIIHSSGSLTSANKNVEITLSNNGSNTGSAFLFNYLGQDPRNVQADSFSSFKGCDLESAGYRLINRNGDIYLQVATKLFNPVNNWNVCNVITEIDYNGDRQADQILMGSSVKGIPWLHGQFGPEADFRTLIFDGGKLRQTGFLPGSYLGSSPMLAFPYSTVSILESRLMDFGFSHVQIRIYLTFRGIEKAKVDIFGEGQNSWKIISMNPSDSGYKNIHEEVILSPGSSKTIKLKKGNNDSESLILFFPENLFLKTYGTAFGSDEQSTIPVPRYSQ